MIRPARLSDVSRLQELGGLMHSITNYANQPYDPVKAGEYLALLITGTGVVFVAEIDGVVVGGIAGACGEQWFNGIKFAFEIAFFIDPARRHGITAIKLVKAFIRWAELMGAKYVEAGVTTGIGAEGIARLYQAVGFVTTNPMLKLEI